MIFLLGKPIVFWLGFVVFTDLIVQIVLGGMMVKGNLKLLKYHKLNAGILIILVIIHLIFGLLLYL